MPVRVHSGSATAASHLALQKCAKASADKLFLPSHLAPRRRSGRTCAAPGSSPVCTRPRQKLMRRRRRGLAARARPAQTQPAWGRRSAHSGAPSACAPVATPPQLQAVWLICQILALNSPHLRLGQAQATFLPSRRFLLHDCRHAGHRSGPPARQAAQQLTVVVPQIAAPPPEAASSPTRGGGT